MAECEKNIKTSDPIPLSNFDESIGVLHCENHLIRETNVDLSDSSITNHQKKRNESLKTIKPLKLLNLQLPFFPDHRSGSLFHQKVTFF